MSQHSMTVANAAGLTFRGDLNTALQALASSNAGTTAPTTTFPCQIWADTTNGLLKQRNSANSAWITLGPLADLGIQSAAQVTGTAGGTVDAITATFTPAIAALTNGMTLLVRAAGANTSTTPTFTPNSGTVVAKTVVKGANTAVAAGDIAGAGHWLELQYDQALDKWVLQNPASGIASRGQICSISASVAANALTLTLNPTTLDFRSATLTSGTPNTRTIQSAISLVVPSGASLGTRTGIADRLALIAIDNTGTVELAVANLQGGLNLDETTLISTTAISSGASSASTVYSATSRTNVPFRVVGFVDIAEVTAGVWAALPGLTQGMGGQAMAAMQSLGYGQKWTDVTASRSNGVNYYNTTGRPIMASAVGNNSASAAQGITGFVNGQTVAINGSSFGGQPMGVTFIVPPGASYQVSSAPGLASFYELR